MPDCLAERVGWPLRGAEGGCATARLEQGPKSSTLSAKMQKAPKGAFYILAVERVLRGECSADSFGAEAGVWESITRHAVQLTPYPDRMWPAGSSTASAMCPEPPKDQELLPQLYLAYL